MMVHVTVVLIRYVVSIRYSDDRIIVRFLQRHREGAVCSGLRHGSVFSRVRSIVEACTHS